MDEAKLHAYKMGYDCGMRGANEDNCNFRIFSAREYTREWERGKKDAEIVKQKLAPHFNP